MKIILVIQSGLKFPESCHYILNFGINMNEEIAKRYFVTINKEDIIEMITEFVERKDSLLSLQKINQKLDPREY